MKIIGLPPKLRREVESLRNEIAAIIANFDSRNSEFSRFDKRRQSLESEIEKLERDADPDDRLKIRQLAERQVELGLIRKKLDHLGDTSEVPITELQPLLTEAKTLLPRVLKPTADAFIERIVKLVRPYYLDRKSAIWAAQQTPAAAQLFQTIHWPHHMPSIGGAHAIVRRCDEVLAGRLKWKFIRTKPA